MLANVMSGYMERLFADDWALDPKVFNYPTNFRPSDFVKGQLAESSEFSDPNTYVVHLHQGIHWQNIPPVNGREFTADDVVFHFDRLFGLGDGFTKPAPYFVGNAVWGDLISVTATDTYTVAFKWKTPNPEQIMETMDAGSTAQCIEAPEAVNQWGDLGDWHHAIGTGPFILQDFVSGSSATLIKNPDYWGYDERYPQNKLPYVNGVNVLIISDDATALAALRSGKIDVMEGISLNNAQNVQNTNPEILQTVQVSAQAKSIDPRVDKAPFNDIKVREALQMALDLPTIAATYYKGSVDPWPSTLTSNYMTGWGLPYEQWPQDLKDQYAYNPTQAKALLTAAGYPNGLKTNVVADVAGDLDVLQIVQSYFAAIGVDMTIQILDSAAWTNLVAVNHNVDQLAARATGNIGNSTEPVRQLSRFAAKQGSNWMMINDPVVNAWFPTAMADTNVGDIKKVVTDANEYFARQHFVISLLDPKLFALYQPWLKGYSGQFNSVQSNTGPIMMSFYEARFWIDQSLKK